MKTIYISYILVAIAGVLTAAGNVCLKISRSNEFGIDFINLNFNPYFMLGILFYAVNVVLFSKSLDKLEVTVAYPLLTAVGYIALFFISVTYLGETVNYVKIIGAVLILLGISFLVSY